MSPLFLLNPTALFSCERVSERPVRARSRLPTDITTPRVTDAPFPLHIRKMRAQSAVCYVRPKRVTKPDGLAASSKLYRALDRYIESDIRPNLEKIRYDPAEILIIEDSTSKSTHDRPSDLQSSSTAAINLFLLSTTFH